MLNFRYRGAFIWIMLLLFLSAYDPPGNALSVAEPYQLQTPWYFPEYVIPEDNPTTKQGVELGRMLFYEKQLSADNSMSCGSCHQQDKAFTDGKKLAVGITGDSISKNAMSLANLLWVKHFNWDGRTESLEAQAREPIIHPLELNLPLEEAVVKLQKTDIYPEKFQQAFGSDRITEENLLKALAQFERTLISDNSKLDQYWRKEYVPTEQEQWGMDLFYTHPEPMMGLRGGNCGDCHLGSLTAGALEGYEGFHNNGLDTGNNLNEGLQKVTGNEYDKGKFRAPSLRNIALTAPYMHDGRFSTLEEVLEHYDEHIQTSPTLDPLIVEASNEVPVQGAPVKLKLTEDEKDAILAFLHMLTDSTFITDDRFSNPFE